MKHGFLVLVLAVVGFALPGVMQSHAGELSDAQKEALLNVLATEKIPVYPGASFTSGNAKADQSVLWFTSKDAPEKIMDWYKGKLSGWSEVTSQAGSRVMYKGKPGIKMEDLITHSYIFARVRNEAPSKDSEITVRIVKIVK
jgi:hypothetical protein